MRKATTPATTTERQSLDARLRAAGCVIHGRRTDKAAVWWHAQHGLHEEFVMARILGLDVMIAPQGKPPPSQP